MKKQSLLWLSALVVPFALQSCDADIPTPAANHELRLTANLCEQLGATRGVQLNTTGSTQKLGLFDNYVESFYVSGFDDQGSSSTGYTHALITPWSEVESDGNGNWKLSGDPITWTDGYKFRLYGYANLPASGATVTQTDKDNLTLSYTVPSNAANQKDILLGFFEGADEDEGLATLYFSHPLTAVAFIEDPGTGKGFRVKTTSGTDPVEVAIKSIELQNVYTSGTTTLTPSLYLPTSTSKLSDVAGALGYTWTNLGTANLTVSQSGTTTAPWLPENATSYHNGSTTVTLDVIGEPFILIPQDVTTNKVTVKIKATILGGGDVELLGTIKDKKWLPGITNIYKLSYTFESLPILLGGSLSVEPYVTEDPEDLNLE